MLGNSLVRTSVKQFLVLDHLIAIEVLLLTAGCLASEVLSSVGITAVLGNVLSEHLMIAKDTGKGVFDSNRNGVACFMDCS